jgi:hypothetical protein
MFTINDTITRLQTLNDQIKEDANSESLNSFKNKFNALVYDLCLSTKEAHMMLDKPEFESFYFSIRNRIEEVQSEDPLKGDFLKRIIQEIVELFSGVDFKYYGIDDLTHMARRYNSSFDKGSHYKLSDNYNLRRIAEHIKADYRKEPNKDTVNVFCPDCEDGEDSACFSHINTDSAIRIYGNTVNDHSLAESKKKLHKVVKGILHGSRIQNNAFDVIYCNAATLTDIDINNYFSNKRPEKAYIADMFKYLKDNGVMVITMPFTRLFKDVCAMLSKQLINIQVCKAELEEFYGLGLIHIVGLKQPSKEIRNEEYIKLRRLYDFSQIGHTRDFQEYTLPKSGTVIELFKGSVLDLDEIQNIVDSSTLMNKVWDSQKAEKLEENIKNPLLPFNIGQIGLVLTSGCLDGLVNEADGGCHLIKGRVSKKTQKTEFRNNHTIEVTETTVNRVEINVLLPNGEFKTLA